MPKTTKELSFKDEIINPIPVGHCIAHLNGTKYIICKYTELDAKHVDGEFNSLGALVSYLVVLENQEPSGKKKEKEIK